MPQNLFLSFRFEELNIQYDGGSKIVNACPNRMDPITTHIIPEEIAKIEIVKGPFTVRFGQNFGGIINLVSKDVGTDKKGVSGNIETGYETNGNNLTERAAIQYASKKFDLQVNGSYRDYGDYEDGNGIEVPASFRTLDYSVKASFKPTKNQKIKLNWRESFGRDIDHAGLMMDSPYDNSYLIGLDYKINAVSNIINSIILKSYYSDVDHLMTNENRPSFMMTDASTNVFAKTYGGKLEFSLSPNDKTMLFSGFDANIIERDGERIRIVKIVNGNPLPQPMTKVDKVWQDSKLSDFGVFSELKYLINDKATLTIGARLDFISASINDPASQILALYGGVIDDQTETNLSGNIALKYKVKNGQVQLAFGSGTRTASMTERFINHFSIGVDPYEYMGNPFLKPETNNQIELSFNKKIKQFRFGSSVFYSYINNYITAIVDENIPRLFMPMTEPRFAKRFVNVDKTTQSGFELFADYKASKSLTISTDLAYTHAQNHDFDEPLAQIQPLTAHIGFKYEKDHFWMHLNQRLVAKQNRISDSFKETETAGFGTLDFSAGFKPFKNFSIGASVLNLFDKAYYEHLNFSFKNSNTNSGRIFETGRNFTLYANYKF
jgi:iron complex outermembrane receptor protein